MYKTILLALYAAFTLVSCDAFAQPLEGGGVMNLGMRTAAWSGKLGGIPSGWVEVEYISSSNGRQYIETGVLPSLNMRFECGVYVTNVQDDYFCSCRIDTGDTRYYLLNINQNAGFAASKSMWVDSAQIRPSIFLNKKHNIVTVVSRTTVELTCDETTKVVNDRTEFISKRTLPLFGGKINNSTSVTNFSKAGTRCYYAKFTDSRKLVRDFVPVRNAITNKGAMCDVLTGEIYHNAGTGAFTIGPDKS